ncbi:hypothetical protein BDW02DRAFT_600793 [Decorospora gaudefroyi]|uniref:Uncharacterized protein n=1 Tax=Decorospora gaudefroyi TaxID=184978 RepID=A0A6A5K2P6_9PLEO|nr:hypothetical protein BDW02DRAFT_600793 [Decorospora gaudefroyi]
MTAVLESVAGALRFCHRSDPFPRGRWHTNTIAGFFQPEQTLAVLKNFSGNPNVEAYLIYTVYFSAPKELTDAVRLDVAEIMSQTADAMAVWEGPRSGMASLRLSGARREKVLDMKKVLEAIFSGRVVTTATLLGGRITQHEIWHDFFATAPGDIWLQHLGREIGVTVMSDKLQRRLRFYDPEANDAYMKTVERRLAGKISILDARQ